MLGRRELGPTGAQAEGGRAPPWTPGRRRRLVVRCTRGTWRRSRAGPSIRPRLLSRAVAPSRRRSRWVTRGPTPRADVAGKSGSGGTRRQGPASPVPRRRRPARAAAGTRSRRSACGQRVPSAGTRRSRAAVVPSCPRSPKTRAAATARCAVPRSTSGRVSSLRSSSRPGSPLPVEPRGRVDQGLTQPREARPREAGRRAAVPDSSGLRQQRLAQRPRRRPRPGRGRRPRRGGHRPPADDRPRAPPP